MKKMTRTDVGLLVLRIGFGFLFLFYGSMKMFGAFGGRGYMGQIEAFVNQGFHPILAHLAIWAEFLGGLMILLGFLTPFGAVAIMCVMATANLRNMSQPGAWSDLVASGDAQSVARFFYTFTLFVVALAILISGPGRLSLDAKLFRSRR